MSKYVSAHKQTNKQTTITNNGYKWKADRPNPPNDRTVVAKSTNKWDKIEWNKNAL